MVAKPDSPLSERRPPSDRSIQDRSMHSDRSDREAAEEMAELDKLMDSEGYVGESEEEQKSIRTLSE